MLHWKIENRDQLNELQGLAFHVAQCEYFKSHNPAELVEIYAKYHSDNITQHFKRLDKLGVPFFVQNSVMEYASDWRRYESTYIDNWFHENRPYIDLGSNF